MGDFYNFLNDKRQQAQPPLPIRDRAPQTANTIMSNTTNKIDAAKRALYEKIEVCCAQYGLHGLQVMEQAITQSLSDMINGVSRPMQQPRPQGYQQGYPQGYPGAAPMPPGYGGYPQPMQQESYQRPQAPKTWEDALADNLINNLDAVMAGCDKDSDLRAQERIKQSMFEQKQYEMMYAQQAAAGNQNPDAILAAHADDFTEVSE